MGGERRREVLPVLVDHLVVIVDHHRGKKSRPITGTSIEAASSSSHMLILRHTLPAGIAGLNSGTCRRTESTLEVLQP